MKNKNVYPSAWIVSPTDKGRKKIYLNNNIYLDNGSEFQIELFNPLTDSILAELKINGKLASRSGLVLRPGERFYLDCYIDDKKKFIFKTYNIESSNEAKSATVDNGIVEISFYKEKVVKNTPIFGGCSTNPWYVQQWTYNPTITVNPFNNVINTSYYSDSSINYMNTSYYSLSNTSSYNLYDEQTKSLNLNQISDRKFRGTPAPSCVPPKFKMEETGRIEKGNNSNQIFESVNMDFESFYVNKITYQLLPNSKKPMTTADFKKSCCGYRLKGSEKFCPNCGIRA